MKGVLKVSNKFFVSDFNMIIANMKECQKICNNGHSCQCCKRFKNESCYKWQEMNILLDKYNSFVILKESIKS